MIKSLNKHHIGVIISSKDVFEIEEKCSEKFIEDKIQGTRVCMVTHPFFEIPTEYIVQEGRAKNYEKGIHHLCYSVENLDALSKFKSFVKENKMGYRLTKLDVSPTKECNQVIFFVLHQLGIIEINVERVE